MPTKQQQAKRGRGRPRESIERRQIGSFMRVTTARRVKRAARDENLSMSQWIERACLRDLERGKDGKA